MGTHRIPASHLVVCGRPGPAAASTCVIASLVPNLLRGLPTPKTAAKKWMHTDECQNIGTVAARPLPPPLPTPHWEGRGPGPPAASASVIASLLPDLLTNLLTNLLTPRPAAKNLNVNRTDEASVTAWYFASLTLTVYLPPPSIIFPVLHRSPCELHRYTCGFPRTLPRSEAMKLIKSLNILLVAALLALASTSGAEAHEKGDKKEGKLPPGVERPPKAEHPPKAERPPGSMKPAKDGSKEAHLNKPPGWTKPPMADRPPGMGGKKGAPETKPPGWTKPPKADSPPRADHPPMADRPAHKKGSRRSAM
eukprot:gene19121-25728_t